VVKELPYYYFAKELIANNFSLGAEKKDVSYLII
jgi:hypothetical protein